MSFISEKVETLFATNGGNYMVNSGRIKMNTAERMFKGKGKRKFIEIADATEENNKPCEFDFCKSCGSFRKKGEFFRPQFCVYACWASNKDKDREVEKNAPLKLFKRPALPGPNPFSKGMMLEAIDPENQSLFCVVSISEVLGYRLKLHFEGYSEIFDFYVNADSMDIFPAGWCSENGYELQPPRGVPIETFNWPQYLMQKKCHPAPRHYFQITKEENNSVLNGVQVGMKLEAVDIRNPSNMMVCVATVTKILFDRFLVHFDSWDNIYDYWADLTCPFVFPVGHCESTKRILTPPNQYDKFNWQTYLMETKSVAMPARLFQPLPPVGFKKGMRIEAVDLLRPNLIRSATITQIDNGHMLTVQYNNGEEAKFTELSPDIHPVDYCQHTGHPLCTSKEKSHQNGVVKPERVIIINSSSDTKQVVPGNTQLVQKQKTHSKVLLNAKKKITEKKMIELATKVLMEKRRKIEAKKLKREKYIFERKVFGLKIDKVRSWGCHEVFAFVDSLPGCKGKVGMFLEQMVDGDSLLLLKKSDLVDFGLKIGVACKIYYAVQLIE